ncbi:MAG: hypothetical protein IJD71_01515 [Clostridia bacterium]|nr:hypothetical protein [Clostridia bacterium]MBQ9919873.1 hypothetical protein [Clostridia bacterium]
MSQQNKNFNKKCKCWINDEAKILSFSYEKGFRLKTFENYQQFIDYCYRKTYQGYLVQ